MTTPNEFKFDCPECGQHIQATKEWSGRKIDCPSCRKPVVIPPPPKPPKENVAPVFRKPLTPLPSKPTSSPTLANPQEKTAAAPAARVPPASAEKPFVKKPVEKTVPVTTVKAVPAQTEKATPVSGAKTGVTSASPTVTPVKRVELTPAAKPVPTAVVRKEHEALRVAVLTPAIKVEMVRAVRRRIVEESHWLPGRIDGTNAYAAKASGSKSDLVEVKDAEASRFSLIGAFELEFHLRNVITTAQGRADFLNQEIPDAVREVLLDQMSEQEREQTEDPLAKTDVMSISHAQCLAVLDVLEEDYSNTMSEERAAKVERRLGNVRLPDLVKKLEARAKIPAEDVATALYHELTEVRRRLERLESRTIHGKKDV